MIYYIYYIFIVKNYLRPHGIAMLVIFCSEKLNFKACLLLLFAYYIVNK